VEKLRCAKAIARENVQKGQTKQKSLTATNAVIVREVILSHGM